jgi:serine/threonine-protein kinase
MIGTRLGTCELIEQIGKGGMATVYRAYQPAMERFVAVKIIHQAIASDKGGLERFQREARLVARLEHPHLLPIYDYNGANDPPYIVMRFLEGCTLKEVLDRRLLPLGDMVHVVRQVAQALDYAHRQGVIHRDIKPTNVMIDQDGNAFLMDFGIARSSQGLVITEMGFAVGTPGYMSPEQGRGEEHITNRADIYSLGVMVYQMVTGEMPYKAETPMMVVLKHINDPVPRARSINPNLTPEMEEAVVKAMDKSPDARFATAADFADALYRSAGRISGTTRPQALIETTRLIVAEQRQARAANQAQIDRLMKRFEQDRPTGMPTPRPPSDDANIDTMATATDHRSMPRGVASV